MESAFDFLELHKLLFENVFPWAGQIRTVNMTTSEFILGDGLVEFALVVLNNNNWSFK